MNLVSLICRKTGLILLTAIVISAASAVSYSETYNWQYWRGPELNGISDESDWDPAGLSRPLKVNWKVNVGAGYSNVGIMGDYLYTLGYDKRERKNVLYCLDIATGKSVWKYSYKASVGDYKGPRTSPVIDNGKVYTLGQDGDFMCNDALTGKLIWKRQVAREFRAGKPRWMFASSVHIEGNMAVVNAGKAGVAVNKKDGKVVWKSKSGVANYSTPVPFKQNGYPYLAIFGKEHLYAVNAKNGRVKWAFPWSTSYDVNAADPGVYKDMIFVSSGYGTGCCLLDVSKGGPRKVWQNKNMSTHISSTIIIDGYIYGIDGNAGTDAKLSCLDIKDGSVVWSKRLGFGNLMAANGYLIVITENGTLHIVRADPGGFKEISRKEGVLGSICWTAPVLCRSTVYLRNNKGDLISIDLSNRK